MSIRSDQIVRCWTPVQNTLTVLWVCWILVSCNSSTPDGEVLKQISTLIGPNKKVLVLQPFEGFPEERTRWLAKQLENQGCKPVVNKPISLPRKARIGYKGSFRSRADTLLSYLAGFKGKDTLILGLTVTDISHTNDLSSDYGIMGLGSAAKGTAVASAKRLEGATRWSKMVKLCIHEIGHMRGLPHCKENKCIMRDAHHKDHLDELTGFCQSCMRTWKEGWL